ncbi:phosphotransferase [Hahella sp. CR1]|uniref:phosphotransferase n=1 Tax=Hahella sp. CR1 TaxID=2992807 RepID=UPI0024416681|nr:phosphotransferase [Hahella sp. CR1]MDG9669698.1 phosphotransferase [Hahella sp. CR1]
MSDTPQSQEPTQRPFVAERLRAADAFLGARMDWRLMLASGHSNMLFRAQGPQGDLVLRINASSLRAFGVDRRLEADVLRLIQGARWAPRVLCNAWREGWLLMMHHGASLTEAGGQDVASQQTVEQLLAFVADLQRITESPAFDYQALIALYRRRLQERAAAAAHQACLQQLEDAFSAIPNDTMALTHHDLHSGNLCLDQGQLIVLDWEYAGLGWPWLDMASLLQHHDLEADDLYALPVCANLSAKEIEKRLHLAAHINQLLEQLWFAVREEQTG